MLRDRIDRRDREMGCSRDIADEGWVTDWILGGIANLILFFFVLFFWLLAFRIFFRSNGIYFSGTLGTFLWVILDVNVDVNVMLWCGVVWYS